MFCKEPDMVYIDFDTRSKRLEQLDSWECKMVRKDMYPESMRYKLMKCRYISNIRTCRVSNTQNWNRFWTDSSGNNCFGVS